MTERVRRLLDCLDCGVKESRRADLIGHGVTGARYSPGALGRLGATAMPPSASSEAAAAPTYL